MKIREEDNLVSVLQNDVERIISELREGVEVVHELPLYSHISRIIVGEDGHFIFCTRDGEEIRLNVL